YAVFCLKKKRQPPPNVSSAQQGGFRSAPRPPGGLYCQESGPASLQLVADEGSNGQTEVYLDVSLTGYVQCSASPSLLSPTLPPEGYLPPGLRPGFPSAPAPPPDLIPPLLPPEGVPDPLEVLAPPAYPGLGRAPAGS